jgi:hypothetical protein
MAGGVAMACAAVAFLSGCGSETGRLEESLEDALNEGKAKVECEGLEAPGRWRCAIEDDPGSTGSRVLLVRLDRSGCWHAFPATHRYEVSRCSARIEGDG